MRLPTPQGPLAALEARPAGVPRGAVVLVPGFTGSKEDFRLVLDPLADRGYHAVAYDQRGQYESPGGNDAAAYSVQALAGDLLHVLATLGPGPVHLVGHSFGGIVARAAVLRRPTSVTSLTLLCSGPAGLTGPRADLLGRLRPLLATSGLPAIADLLDAAAAADARRAADSPELRAFLRTRFLASTPTALVAMADALLGEPDRVDALRQTGVPLLVAYGEQDDAWPPAVQAEMAQRLAARQVVLPNAFHGPAVENPAATVACLAAFFDEHLPAS